jgi:hypothetical protein
VKYVKTTLPGSDNVEIIFVQQSTDVAILKERAKQKSLYSIQPLQEQEKQENSLTRMAKLLFLKTCNQESSNGTTITLDILVSTEPKKPLVNTFGGLK